MAILDPTPNRDSMGAVPAQAPFGLALPSPGTSSKPGGGSGLAGDHPGVAAAARAGSRRAARAILRWLSPRRLAATIAFLGGLARQIRRRRAEQRLTIAVDIDSLYETLTGVGWYLYELLAHLAQRDDLRLRLYGQNLAPALRPGGQPPLAPAMPLPAGPAIEHVTCTAPDGMVIPPWRADQWLRRAAPLLMAADRNRILFGPNFLLPPLFRFAAGARVVTIHDLSFRRLPWALRPDTARALADRMERTLLEADLVLVDSLAVAGELAAGGLPPSRVRAIHLGPGHLSSPSALAAVTPPQDTPPRYGLFVGTLEPRKNVATLLTAWAELRRDGGVPPLLLCGTRGWGERALRRQLAEAEREGWLRYLGYVSPAELAALYRGAAVVALPSLYEGFGMPAVEAMVAGAPLVLSDLPVFREVAGDAALYAPAGRPDLWCDRLRQVLSDDALRQDLSYRAKERGARFDWQRTAAATADAWRAAAGNQAV